MVWYSMVWEVERGGMMDDRRVLVCVEVDVDV